MNHSLAPARPPLPPTPPPQSPPMLTTLRGGDGPSNATLRFVDDVHRRVSHALSLRGGNKNAEAAAAAAASVEETWSAIKNSPVAARLTEEVIRPMFTSPFQVADEDENAVEQMSSGRPNSTAETARKENIPRTKIRGKPGKVDSVALEAKRRKSQWQRQRRRHRNPQRKKILYSPLYPFKILQPRKKPNSRNRQEGDSRKRRRRPNIKNGISGYQRPHQSRPSRPPEMKNEDHTRRDNPGAVQPYKFWLPQKNFFSVQIPTVRKHTNQRRHEKRRQKHGKNSEEPKELELFWSDHLRDKDRDREGSKSSRRRKHRGETTVKDEVVPSQHVVHHHNLDDGEGHTNIVIRVLIHLLKNCYLETSAIVYYYHYNE